MHKNSIQLSGALLLLLPLYCCAQPNIKKIYDHFGIAGSTTIFDNKQQKWIYTDSSDSKLPLQPASTFKIIHLLIALETGVINDEHAVIKWPGSTDTTLYGYRPDIYKDISVKEAFEVSAGWAFIEIAKKINRVQYEYYLRLSGYGNLDLSEKGDDFWNFGAMKISPENQINFLRQVHEHKTPFSDRNLAILKRVMITEQTDDYILRSKTGWTRMNGQDIGWWVGYVESKDNTYFFATRIVKPLKEVNKNFLNYRKEITKSILRAMRAIE